MTQNNQLVTAQVANVLRSQDMQGAMGKMLPPSVNLDKFTEVTIAAIGASPEVLEADRDSLYRACVAAARRGLLPDKKEGALVIYNTNVGSKEQPRSMKLVQFLPMVEGVLKEMAKAGIKAYAVSVYENDTISFWNDDEGQHVRHEPIVFGDRGAMVGVFAAAKTEDGRPYVEAMSIADIEQVARRSKQCYSDQRSGKLTYGGTWKSDFDRMAQKSALHRLRKRLPISDEDSLQNLKDMEETTDIDLSAGAAPAPVPGSDTPVTGQPSAPPPEQQHSLPPPDASADEVLKPQKARTPRRSRVLEGVTVQANGEHFRAPNKAAEQPTKANSTGSATPDKPKATPSPQPAQQPEPEWGEDDIV